MRLKVLLIALLIVALFKIGSELSSANSNSTQHFLPLVYAATNTTGNQTSNQTLPLNVFTIDRTFYSPVKVQITYPYTHDHSISEITTIWHSFPKETSDPTTLIFTADEIDVYTFTVTIAYENSSVTTMLIAISQGDLAVEGYSWAALGTQFSISFRLNVISQPHYPTESDVAKEVVKQIALGQQQALEQMQNLVDQTNNMALFSTVLCIATTSISITALLISLGVMARRRRGQE